MQPEPGMLQLSRLLGVGGWGGVSSLDKSGGSPPGTWSGRCGCATPLTGAGAISLPLDLLLSWHIIYMIWALSAGREGLSPTQPLIGNGCLSFNVHVVCLSVCAI